MNKNNNIISIENDPICLLDPLLLIPRIEYIDCVLSYIKSQEQIFTLVILDMKNFHVINDVFNYTTGDKVLSAFISLLRLRLPIGSITLRFRHGDEFLFFIPLDMKQAQKIFYEYHDFCSQYTFLTDLDGSNYEISFRYALVELDKMFIESDSLLDIAESKLREVKAKGSPRN